MNRKLWLVAILLLASFNFVEAQQPVKIPRIGYISRTGNGQGDKITAVKSQRSKVTISMNGK